MNIHFQLKDLSALCGSQLFFNRVTNDKDSVTCKFCRYKLKHKLIDENLIYNEIEKKIIKEDLKSCEQQT